VHIPWVYLSVPNSAGNRARNVGTGAPEISIIGHFAWLCVVMYIVVYADHDEM